MAEDSNSPPGILTQFSSFVTMNNTFGSILLLVAVFLACSDALGYTPPLKTKRRFAGSPIAMAWFDFKPVQGAGSGKDALDEQWEAQQEILNARRGHCSKQHLKNKYGKKKEVKTKVETDTHQSQVNVSKKQDSDMFVEDSPTSAFKFPWDK